MQLTMFFGNRRKRNVQIAAAASADCCNFTGQRKNLSRAVFFEKNKIYVHLGLPGYVITPNFWYYTDGRDIMQKKSEL